MPERFLNNDIWQFLIKIMFPSFITVGVMTAIDMKNDVSKVSWLTTTIALTIGLGGSYLAGDFILAKVSPECVTLAASGVTLITEKTFKFFIHKLKVDTLIMRLIDSVIGSTEKKNPS